MLRVHPRYPLLTRHDSSPEAPSSRIQSSTSESLNFYSCPIFRPAFWPVPLESHSKSATRYLQTRTGYGEFDEFVVVICSGFFVAAL